MERQVLGLQEQVDRLQRKKQLFSWQQAEGIITGQELLAAHHQLKSEESLLNTQLDRLKAFNNEPSPMTLATFKKLAECWSESLANEFNYVSDEIKAKIAEFFNLYITVHPKESSKGYSFNLMANIPPRNGWLY